MAGTTVRLGSNGRFVIPAEHRKALGLSEGDHLLVRVQDGELRLSTLEGAVTRAQSLVARHVPAGHLLSEELLADRQAETERDR